MFFISFSEKCIHAYLEKGLDGYNDIFKVGYNYFQYSTCMCFCSV